MFSRLSKQVQLRQYCSQAAKDGIYNRALKKYPLLMQAIQTSGLMGTGDLISQCLVEGKRGNEIDLKRTLKFAAMGMLVVSG